MLSFGSQDSPHLLLPSSSCSRFPNSFITLITRPKVHHSPRFLRYTRLQSIPPSQLSVRFPSLFYNHTSSLSTSFSILTLSHSNHPSNDPIFQSPSVSSVVVVVKKVSKLVVGVLSSLRLVCITNGGENRLSFSLPFACF